MKTSIRQEVPNMKRSTPAADWTYGGGWSYPAWSFASCAWYSKNIEFGIIWYLGKLHHCLSPCCQIQRPFVAPACFIQPMSSKALSTYWGKFAQGPIKVLHTCSATWALLVCHADEFLVLEGGLKSTHTGNTIGDHQDVWNCNPDDLIW